MIMRSIAWPLIEAVTRNPDAWGLCTFHGIWIKQLIKVMTTILSSNDEPSEPKHESSSVAKGRYLSSSLERAIANLLLLPEFQAVAREHGDAMATRQVTQQLRDMCPELFASETNGLTLSLRLKDAIANLLALPEFQGIAQQHGEAIAKLRVTQFLRETRPELFSPENPGDALARLFADLESGNH